MIGCSQRSQQAVPGMGAQAPLRPFEATRPRQSAPCALFCCWPQGRQSGGGRGPRQGPAGAPRCEEQGRDRACREGRLGAGRPGWSQGWAGTGRQGLGQVVVQVPGAWPGMHPKTWGTCWALPTWVLRLHVYDVATDHRRYRTGAFSQLKLTSELVFEVCHAATSHGGHVTWCHGGPCSVSWAHARLRPRNKDPTGF